MLNKEQVIKRINDLLSTNGHKRMKYMRNNALYNQTPGDVLDSKAPLTVGFMDDVYSEDTSVPKLNVIKSAIDAVVSKMATAHVRPFVNTVKGSFKTIQVCKQLQIYFDYLFDEEEVSTKITEGVRDACIFDTGYIYFNETDGHIYNLQPWNVYTRPSEKNDFRSVYIEFPNTVVDNLDEELSKLVKTKELYCKIGFYYDSVSQTKAILVDRVIKKIEDIKFDVVPVVPIYYTLPTVGNSCLSITDMLKGIQYEVDKLMTRMSEATENNPAQTFFLSNATNIKVGQLNNKVGNIVQFNSPNGESRCVESFTPDFISGQYLEYLDGLIEKAYNMVGISQLSAQGKKPTGLDSGVALATQADLESDRFQILLDQYVSTFNKVAKLICKMMNADSSIIEPNRYSLQLKWSDVSKEYDKMRIQFSAADSLSKDPSEKLKQLQMLAQAGIIPPTQIPALLELPDINRGFNAANNAYNACMTLIDQCIYEDKFEVPEYVPVQMLKEQIVNMELSLRAASVDGSNDEDIEKLKKYFEEVEQWEADIEAENEADQLEEEAALAESGIVSDFMNSASAGQQQQVANDTSTALNNMYSQQNNPNLSSGTEDSMNMTNEAVANPMDVAVDNGELSNATMEA